MGYWSSAFLTEMRKEWMRRIAKVQYYGNSTWYTATINSKSVSGENIVVMAETTDSVAMTITSVRLIGIDGTTIGSQSENITKTAAQSVLLQLDFPIYEA